MATLAVVAVVLLVASVLPGLALGGASAGRAEGLSFAVALALNAVVFLCVFGLLGHRPDAWRELFPGVAVATLGSLVLQCAGGLYLDRVCSARARSTGASRSSSACSPWFWLGAHLLLIAAEVNVVLARRLWPRTLTDELGDADRRALAEAAEAARLDEHQEVVVRYRLPVGRRGCGNLHA